MSRHHHPGLVTKEKTLGLFLGTVPDAIAGSFSAQ